MVVAARCAAAPTCSGVVESETLKARSRWGSAGGSVSGPEPARRAVAKSLSTAGSHAARLLLAERIREVLRTEREAVVDEEASGFRAGAARVRSAAAR